MFAWLKRLFDRSDDPVYSCDLYRDKAAGSCAHVDGPLCDFPKCSMLADYRSEKEGMTIAGSGASELGKLMREQHGKSGPVPHASRRLTQDIHQMPDNLARALAALPASLERQE